MPQTADYIKMTKAATQRRREVLKEQEPVWSQWLPENERDTTHVHPKAWINWIPYTGTKLDAIDYHTVVLATYNETIERLQQDPDRFPLMNSAFIQFNHQVAAHMACQSVNHHMPTQMAPRTVEISPEDIHWDNLSIAWWMRYLRTALVSLYKRATII
jgi:calcium permeable stress-gated cation channel